jgi:hypothetical protein
MMTFMKKMKCLLQREKGQVILPNLPNSSNDPNKQTTISGMLNPKLAEENNKRNYKLADGYWITLQDWSMCTLKCGGGKSYLQRMCVPPKEGGKPCIGEAILSKDCNKVPCPNYQNKSKDSDSLEQKVLKPIVKIMPFSSRPQRYSKCVIKESDMMYTKSMNKKDFTTTEIKVDRNSEATVQVPVRVIMNNRTLTIFAGDGYETHLDSFNILNTNFEIVAEKDKEPECFILRSENKFAKLCPFGSESKSQFVDEWRFDYNLFKYQCNFGHKEPDMQITMKKKLEEKIAAAKDNLMDEVQDEVKRKAQIQEENKLKTRVQSINKVALKAIEKEINLEEMIKKEEEERERKEEEDMKARIQKEQDKQVKK